MEGNGLVVAVCEWDQMPLAETWHRLRDRDAPDCPFAVRLYLNPDQDALEACVAPSRLSAYAWAYDWPFEDREPFACVPHGSLTVFGPPTEDAWETVLRTLAEAPR